MDRGSAGLLRHHLHLHHQQAGLLRSQAVRRKDPHRQLSEQQRPTEPNVSEILCNLMTILKILCGTILLSFGEGAPCWPLPSAAWLPSAGWRRNRPRPQITNSNPGTKKKKTKKKNGKSLLARPYSLNNATLSGSLRCICRVLAPVAWLPSPALEKRTPTTSAQAWRDAT